MFLGLKAPHWALKEGSGIKSSVDSTLLFWFINLAIFARLLTEGDESPLRRCRWNSFLCQNTPADAPCLHQGGGKCTRECVCVRHKVGLHHVTGWTLALAGGCGAEVGARPVWSARGSINELYSVEVWALLLTQLSALGVKQYSETRNTSILDLRGVTKAMMRCVSRTTDDKRLIYKESIDLQPIIL